MLLLIIGTFYKKKKKNLLYRSFQINESLSTIVIVIAIVKYQTLI